MLSFSPKLYQELDIGVNIGCFYLVVKKLGVCSLDTFKPSLVIDSIEEST